ncbi:RES family NAD+ phosphorylase [Pedobacter hartonius]|uniref:RES domain-containing protein n=1 Tax=Pedobacter hartonius TaxID=425514 RepID=A0A1H4FUB2_9SPHI|nr:RES family NAD+ phosphorylase [Pedobacter hartonius]SEB00420.1 RES domain-containing protein [Pedobacter hartonius]
MQIYRLSKQPYSGDTEGLGSRLNGGRWNNAGIPCIYASESRALAILEYAANIELNSIPRNLNITTYEIPEAEFRSFKISELPGDWQSHPGPQSTKDFGSKLFLEKEYLGVKLPSSIIAKEYNYLINPLSAKMELVKVLNASDFIFDVRIKK